MSDMSKVYMHWTSGYHPVGRTNEWTMNWNVIQWIKRPQLLRRGNRNANHFGHFMEWRFLPFFFSVTFGVCQGGILNPQLFVFYIDGLCTWWVMTLWGWLYTVTSQTFLTALSCMLNFQAQLDWSVAGISFLCLFGLIFEDNIDLYA